MTGLFYLASVLSLTSAFQREIICEPHWDSIESLIEYGGKHSGERIFADLRLSQINAENDFNVSIALSSCEYQDEWSCKQGSFESKGMVNCKFSADPVTFICENFPFSKVTEVNYKDYLRFNTKIVSETVFPSSGYDPKAERTRQYNFYDLIETNAIPDEFNPGLFRLSQGNKLSLGNDFYQCRMTYKR